ncbi:hypothetical protein K2173_015322 [Erythroxylum novogranatense]|uniref:MI domain-containing protein n=1 Tax=Erythroxylum novogranatense TaxID=1862640 RepID=A0AAV8T323_9ROSI|nr:hypothetical protein K2173_015322 [Erythroxylum novogranatense]
MEYSDGFVSKEHRELARSAPESADPLSVFPLELSLSPKSNKRLSNSPKSPRSPDGRGKNGTSRGSPGKGSSLKQDRHPHSQIDERPKKGGSGGKGTWGGLLDTDDSFCLDPNDPNYESSAECNDIGTTNVDFDDYKKKTTIIVEEYFTNDDIVSTTNELRDLGMPVYHYYLVKKLISMAMDRHDREKEMTAVLLSSIYVDIIDPAQVYKGFEKLVQSADDLIVDIPDIVDVLALFIARAVVDDILPPAFLEKQKAFLAADSKGLEALQRSEKCYLAAPLHTEIIERRWGGNKNRTVEDVKAKINNLLIEYVASGDKKEAFRCIKDLKVPFFHHEIIKRALLMAMDRQQAEGRLLDLMKEASEVGLINSSQIIKGFGRMIDVIDDLSLDIPNARWLLQCLISKAASEGWLSASSLKSVSSASRKQDIEDNDIKVFKTKAESIIKEYFLTGDISEVNSCLESENSICSSELNAIFVKRLITLSMDRKNREKEMASVLLSSLCFATEDFMNGFHMLIDSAEDTALDHPIVVEDLAMFLSRAVIDEVLAPQHLQELENQFLGGNKVIQMAKSLLKARLSGERILRCWGGGGNGKHGWALEDVKDKIGKLLEEFESGGDVKEASHCIKELGMPFFHHEIIKKVLIAVIEKKNEKLWGLLDRCFCSGLITQYQMTKGFERVAESLDDLILDVPYAENQFVHYVERAKLAGWLDSLFWFDKSRNSLENGTCL